MPPDAVRGKRFEVKSKADETEKDLPWRFNLELAAGLWLSSGSSCSRDNFRDEDTLGDEVDSVEALALEEDDAREASSRESRTGG